MRFRWRAQAMNVVAWRVWLAAALLTAGMPGCAEVPGVDKFLFATNADRDDAAAAIDADATGTDDVAVSEVTGDADVSTDAPDGGGIGTDTVDAATADASDGDSADSGADSDATADADAAVEIDAGPNCATLGDCSDGDACTKDSCVEGTGCVHVLKTAADCADDKFCTSDACSAALGCVHTPIDVTAACTDNDACSIDLCQDPTGCVHTALNCDDGSKCTVDSCDAKAGCTHSAVGCDDGKACTGDSCDPSVGCVSVALSATPCDDEDACTSADTCTSGTCAGTAINCKDSDPCTIDSCDTLKGCGHKLDATATCDDANSCTSDDSCASGTCAGLLRLWQSTVNTDQDAVAVAARPTGGFVTVTRNNKVLAVRAWGKGGAVDWSAIISTSPIRAGVAVAANGDVAVVGGQGNDGFVNVYSSTGAIIAASTISSGSTGELDAILADPAGGFHAYGRIQGGPGDPGDAWFIDLDAAGAVKLNTKGGGATLDALYAAAVASDGNFIVGGIASTSANSGPFLMKVTAGPANPSVSSLWTYNFPCAGTGRFNVVAPAKDGGVFAIGEVDVLGDGLMALLYVRLDGAGKVLWSHVDAAKGANNVGTGAAALTDGRWMIACRDAGAVLTSVLDTDGTPLWTHTSSDVSMPRMTGLVDGTVAFVSAGGSVVHARRIDHFGNADCASSGGCVDIAFATCSDGNTCTSDECDLGGCSHPYDFVATPCADGNACHAGGACNSGSCNGGADVLGFNADSAFGEGTQIAALPDGAWVIATTTQSPMGFALVAYSATGKQKWTKSYPGYYGGSVFVDGNGNTLAFGYSSMTSSGWMRRVAPDGTETANLTLDLKGANMLTFVGGVETAKDGYVLLANDGAQGYFIQVGSGGQVYGMHPLPSMSQLRGPALAPDGGLYFTGSATSGSMSQAFVAKYSAWGEKLWRYDYTPPAGSGITGSLSAPTVLPDGGCAVGIAADTMRILRFGPDGLLKQTDSFATGIVPGATWPSGMAATSDGSLIVTIASTPLVVRRVDPQGNVVASAPIAAGPAPGNTVAIAVSLKDRLAFTSFYVNPAGGMGSLGVWRMDAFLNSTCTASGNCAGMVPSTCNTGNSCQLDTCATSACVHTARADGAACTDGSACTYADACAAKTCVPGQPVLGAFPGKATFGQGVLPWGDASLTVSQVNNTLANHAYVEKRDATGAAVWGKVSLEGQEVFESRATLDGAGGVLIAGRDGLSDAGWIWRLDAAGNATGTGSTYGAGNNSEFRAVLANGASGYYAVGSTGKTLSSGRQFWLVPLLADLSQNGSAWEFGTSGSNAVGNHDTATSAALAMDGSVYIIGNSVPQTGTPSAAHIVKVDPATGSTYWQYTNGSESSAYDIVALPDGGCFAAGTAYGLNSEDIWIAKFNSNGGQDWSRMVDDNNGSGTDDFAFGAAALADGTFAVVGRTTAAHLWRFDASSAPIGDWSLGGYKASRVAQAGTGGLLIATTATSSVNDVLLHTDLFGNQTCGDSGVCFDYGTQSCDDKNPCTLDVCAGKCKHINVADSLPCEDGDMCTADETCTAGVCGNGKSALWQTADPTATSIASVAASGSGFVTSGTATGILSLRSWSMSGTSKALVQFKGVVAGNGRIQGTMDGGYVAAGRTNNALDTDAWIARFDGSQQKMWMSMPGNVGSADVLNAVVSRNGGGYWAVGAHSAVGGGLSKCWIQQVSGGDGSLGTVIDLGDPLMATVCENATGNFTGGSILVVGSASPGGTGTSSGYIASLNSAGGAIWSGGYVGTGATSFYDAASTPEGGAIAVGTTAGIGANKLDIVVVRFDSQGTKSWVRKLDFASGPDEGRGIYLRNDGTMDVAGACNGQFCLAHLSATGNLQWNQTYGTSGGRALAIAAADWHSLVLAGESASQPFIRVDWSGNATCTDSGSCINYGATDCDSSMDCGYARCSVGKCAKSQMADGLACDDGNLCTSGDLCSAGKCMPGAGGSCGDGICSASCGDTAAICPADCF